MLVAARRTSPSKGGAAAELKPPTAPPTSEKPKRAAGKARKTAAAAVKNQEDEEKTDGCADIAAGESGDNGTTEAPSAEPVKRKRGRRRLIHDEEERKLRRKMQCKLNQRRYRARQRGMITTLSLDAEKTIDNIQELEAYHRFLGEFDAERTAAQSTLVDRRPSMVVKQFLELFRHGFALHSVEVGEIQEWFLRFAMDPTLQSQGATHSGIDALILQLKRYSSYHAVFEILTETTQIVNNTYSDTSGHSQETTTPISAVVHVSGKLHLRMSRDTVMLLYPHIIEDDELNMRVVGHEIYPGFSMVFYFNDLSKVVKFEFTVDFVAAFMKLLRNSTMTARLMEKAIITPFCELGVEPHGAVDTNDKASKQLSLKFILL